MLGWSFELGLARQHTVQSMEAMIAMSHLAGKAASESSSLLIQTQLNPHVEPKGRLIERISRPNRTPVDEALAYRRWKRAGSERGHRRASRSRKGTYQ